MQIRVARESDIPRINALLAQVCLVHHRGRPDIFKQGRKYTDEQLCEILRDSERPIIVAADEEDVVQGYAFCILKQFVEDNIMTDIKTLYIDDLCVDETMRGQHIGKALYDAAIELARERGCYNLTLNVWSCNSSAMGFYRACGLTEQKIGMEIVL